jgi:peptide/nickel transport system permease protein
VSLSRRALHVGSHLLSAVPTLIGILLVTFVLVRVLPSDPASLVASPSASNAELNVIRQRMGLDKSIPQQLGIYLAQLAKGDLGHSNLTGQPVLSDLRARLPASIELGGCALLLALIFAIPLGVFAALRPNSIVDNLVRLICSVGVAVPTFVSGLLFIYVFYYLLGWAPDPTGRIDVFIGSPPNLTGFYLIDTLAAGNVQAFGAALHQLVLPAVTLAFFTVAPLARVTRASMVATLQSEFITTAESIGLGRGKIIVAYAMRNAMLPVITTLSAVFSSLLGASIMVEKVFAWPGIASYAADALAAGDFAPVQGFVLLMSVTYVLLNGLIDVLYRVADPRVSL